MNPEGTSCTPLKNWPCVTSCLWVDAYIQSGKQLK